MEYRAHMMGGTVAFEEPGVGTHIVLTCSLTLLRKGRSQDRRSA
jgi:hypothetical protein